MVTVTEAVNFSVRVKKVNIFVNTISRMIYDESQQFDDIQKLMMVDSIRLYIEYIERRTYDNLLMKEDKIKEE